VLLVVAVLALAVGVSVFALGGSSGKKAATTTTAPAAALAAPPKPFRIVFPEGFTRAQMGVRVKAVAQIAEHERHRPVRLSRAAYLATSRSAVVPCFGGKRQTDLEGFLFPATYDFLRKTPSRALVAAQLQTFCDRWQTVDLSYARSKNLTQYDVLKIASMVEEEAAVPADRSRVAAVIYNRLRNRMPLQIDATLRYGLHIPPTQSITQSELGSDNPYNTRKLMGLPPTPIANPGLASIRAAAHPSRLGYLYYARIPATNRHVFFESYPTYERYLSSHGYGPHN
jgi:uncharacterized YceG family protein